MITQLVKLLFQADDQASPEIKKLQGLTGEFLGGVVKGAAAAAAAFVSVQAAFEGFSAAIARADALDDLSEKTGIASDKLSELAFAARVGAGGDVNTLAGAFRFLTKSMSQTEQESSKQAEAFKKIGVSATDAQGNLRATDEVFADIADKFQGLAAGPEKAALALELFGGRGTELIPILNLGRQGIEDLRKEAEELGLIIPPEQAAAAGQFGDNLERLKSVFDGLFNALTAQVVPVLNQVIDAIVMSAREGGTLRAVLDGIILVFNGALVPAGKVVIAIFNGFVAALRLAGRALGAVAAGLVQLFSGNFAGAKAAVSGLGDDFKQTAAEVAEFQRKLFETPQPAAAAGSAADGLTTRLNRTKTAAKEVKSELEGFIATLQRTNVTFGLTDEQIAQFDAASKYLRDLQAGVNPQRAQQLYQEATALIQQNAALKANAEAAKESEKALTDRNKEVQRAAEEAKRELDALLAGTSQVLFESVQRNILILDEALADGKIKYEQYIEAIALQYDRLAVKNKETGNEIQEFWKSAAEGIQGNLQTFFFDALQGDFGNLGESIKRTIDQIIAQILAARAAAALFGQNFAKGEIGGFVGQGLSALFGRATGGGVQAGRAYMVGERGPEPFIPNVNGRVISNREAAEIMGGGSAKQTVQVTIQTMDANSFTQNLSRFKRELAEVMTDARVSYRMG